MKFIAIVSGFFVLFASTLALADFRPGRVRLALDCKSVDGQPYGAQILVADGSAVGTLSVNVMRGRAVGTIESFNVVNRLPFSAPIGFRVA